jgi:hypothetical protein
MPPARAAGDAILTGEGGFFSGIGDEMPFDLGGALPLYIKKWR